MPDLDALRTELLIDQVTAIGTVQERFRLDRDAALEAVREVGAQLKVIHLQAVHGRPRSRGAFLLVQLAPRGVRLSRDAGTLGHAAGLAQCRLAFQHRDGLGTWTVDPRHGDDRPDAVWTDGTWKAAVEFERWYSPGRLRAKIQAFRERSSADQLYWGGVSTPVVGRMRRLYGEVPDLYIAEADWYSASRVD